MLIKKNEISNNLTKISVKEKYIISNSKKLNILFVGKGRSGKTSFKNLLQSPHQFSKDLKLHAGTIDSEIHFYVLSDKLNNNQYTLDIIDTPGLFERRENENEARENSNLINLIKVCVEREITNFHCVCFFISCPKGIDQEDIKSIIEFQKIFFGKDIANNACLVLTRCEKHSNEYLEQLKFQLYNDKDLKNIKDYFKLGLFYSGLIDHNDFNNSDDQAVYRQYKQISKYRNEFIDMLLRIQKPFMVNETAFSEIKNINGQLKIMQDELTKKDEEIKNIINQKDITQKELQRKLINVINEKESIKTKKEKIESRGVFERLFNIN